VSKLGGKTPPLPGLRGLRILNGQGGRILSRAAARNNGPVPELPDLRILAEAFTAALTGRPLLGTAVQQPLVLRGTAAELRGVEGRRLEGVAQRGKFLTLGLGSDRIVINAMLTGRLGLATPGSKAFAATAVVFTFGPRAVAPPQRSVATWTRDAPWIPDDDNDVELRYRDPKRMGKVYVLPAGIERSIAGWDALGPDVDDDDLDASAWQARIRRHSGELHNLLKNQTFVAGIGNAYSDEVLWAAKLGPFRTRASLADEESERLWRASRETMAWAIEELRARVPPHFERQARDFLHVHRKGGRPCPRCGTTLSEVAPGGFVTTWCRSCQA
jgi:formamidopyrimidine-DNA glycosylase